MGYWYGVPRLFTREHARTCAYTCISFASVVPDLDGAELLPDASRHERLLVQGLGLQHSSSNVHFRSVFQNQNPFLGLCTILIDNHIKYDYIDITNKTSGFQLNLDEYMLPENVDPLSVVFDAAETNTWMACSPSGISQTREPSF